MASTALPSTPPPSIYSADRLESNLRALGRRDPELAARLRLPVDSSRVVFHPGGLASYRLHRGLVPLDVPEPEAIVRQALASRSLAPGSLQAAPQRPAAVLLGVGLGELIEALLATDLKRVVAWDADPWHLRLALQRLELAEELASGRLCLLLGCDLLRSAHPIDCARVEHPLLARLHRSEIDESRRARVACRAVVASGGLFVEEVRRSLVRRGFGVWTLDVQGLAREELQRSVECLRPSFFFSVNYTEGLAEFCAANEIPLVVWEVDPALGPPRPLRSRSSRTRIFTYREASAAAFRAAGFPEVSALPLAADPELRCPLRLSPDEHSRHASSVAFVGSSMVANATRLRELLMPLWAAHLGGGNEARKRACAALERILADQRLDLSGGSLGASIELHAPGLRQFLVGQGLDALALIGESAAAEKRLRILESLSGLDVSVWGDEGWRALAPYGVRWRGMAGHRDELTRIYNAARIHIDVGRLYQNDIVPMRVFDVLACGGFLIAEHSAQLAELFRVGIELESWRTAQELREKLEYYLARPDEARAIAHEGRAAVLERHTIDARLEQMLGMAS